MYSWGWVFFPNQKSHTWAPNYQHYKTKLKLLYTVPVGKYIHRQVIVCQDQMLKINLFFMIMSLIVIIAKCTHVNKFINYINN